MCSCNSCSLRFELATNFISAGVSIVHNNLQFRRLCDITSGRDSFYPVGSYIPIHSYPNYLLTGFPVRLEIQLINNLGTLRQT